MARLTVLGSCGAYPEPGRACSGFLLDHHGFRVVLDLGYGTFARLLEHVPDGGVDAAVITHAHPDHCSDLSALGRIRAYNDGGKVPLYCPPGVLDVLRAVEPNPDPAEVYEFHELSTTTSVGPFTLRTWRLPHHVPNWGVRLSLPDLTVAYTGDSGPDPALAELGADADLFIVESTLQGPSPRTQPRYVMTATEAAGWAARAGAKRLLLTHFWPGSDRRVSAREADGVFDGEVLLAEEGLTLEL
ncbi:MBL fold metallo-hydrolase [Amycolatopsis sp. 195334CR]|uniref:MBL fold metallo-hydrolase n=1 Tax=Amycolatopsis sp. 195334CR TaxID=2814588 RepID=UPI001A90C0DC|nr:MBL fold metallo-hydrolase [Amycolatopsis sp. 195334CR]MBN6036488.1 MBL fold metallo-hydrolase [Amycolatopsis sp. 195334CR]